MTDMNKLSDLETESFFCEMETGGEWETQKLEWKY